MTQTPRAGHTHDVKPSARRATVLEHAVLDVVAGREADFEEAFEEAKGYISSARGFCFLQLSRSLEHPHRYLLLVGWETLADHTEGFRGSPAYDEWRRLLHHFYEPFPAVEHFTEAARA